MNCARHRWIACRTRIARALLVLLALLLGAVPRVEAAAVTSSDPVGEVLSAAPATIAHPFDQLPAVQPQGPPSAVAPPVSRVVGGAAVGEHAQEHPFWSLDANGWVSAEDLSVGTVVRGLDEDWEVVAHEVVAEPTVVYNLTVAEAHTYFVGDAGAAGAVWVHNDCAYGRFDELLKLDPTGDAKVRAVNGLSASDEILPSHRFAAFEAWRDSGKFVIDVPESEIIRIFENANLVAPYMNHLRRLPRSTRGGTIVFKDNQLDELRVYARRDAGNLRHVDQGELNGLRSEFDGARDRLRAEWTQRTGQEWPTYTQADIDRMIAEGKGLRKRDDPKGRWKKGDPIKSIGDPYDAHHVIPLEFNGTNEWWNMWPAMFPFEHQGGIHAKGSPLRRLVIGVNNAQ